MGTDFLVFVLLSLVGGAAGWAVGRFLGRFDATAAKVALGLILTFSFAGWLGLTILLEAGLRSAVAAWFLCVATGLVGFSRKRRAASGVRSTSPSTR